MARAASADALSNLLETPLGTSMASTMIGLDFQGKSLCVMGVVIKTGGMNEELPATESLK
jgi:hypothetical protein